MTATATTLNSEIRPDADEICDGIDNDCNPLTDEDGDLDGDGFAVCEGDCADENPDIGPHAEEICEGLDTDCDGVVPPEERDADGDGSPACEDCDDSDPDTYAGAPEVCDGLDNDCDGTVSPEESDGDGDGALACEDCDDADPEFSPGAVEICDGLDNDCDGLIDNDIDRDGDGFPNACGEGGNLDVLVVVDDSCSMEDEQATLAGQADDLFETLAALATDYNIAVMDSTDGEIEAVIQPETRDPRGVFAEAVVQGSEGVGHERSLDNALAALVDPELVGEGGPNAGWRRRGAALMLLVLSDEDDQSDLLLNSELLPAFGEVVDPRYLQINAIAGGAVGCFNESRQARPSPRLDLARRLTGGEFQEICEPPWTFAGLIPERPLDCDDDDPANSPAGVEICDGGDNNCDGARRVRTPTAMGWTPARATATSPTRRCGPAWRSCVTASTTTAMGPCWRALRRSTRTETEPWTAWTATTATPRYTRGPSSSAATGATRTATGWTATPTVWTATATSTTCARATATTRTPGPTPRLPRTAPTTSTMTATAI